MLAALLLASSCESDSGERAVVRQFMEEQTTMNSPEVVSWSQRKTTCRVTPTVMQSMRDRATRDKLVKAGVNYASQSDTLVYFQVKVVADGDTLSQTYYLNEKEKGVVGFK